MCNTHRLTLTHTSLKVLLGSGWLMQRIKENVTQLCAVMASGANRLSINFKRSTHRLLGDKALEIFSV